MNSHDCADPTLTFLGATGTVTGFKYLLEVNGVWIIVDCSLFQGKKPLRQRNRQPLTFDAADLDGVLLPDSGYFQEADARYANRRGFSKHQSALPLYTRADAEACLEALGPIDFNHAVPLGEEISATFQSAEHIPSAASIRFSLGDRTLTFSGDLGCAA